MPVVVATFVPKPEEFQNVLDALSKIVPEVHKENGCELYSLHRSKGKLVMIEKWSDRESLDEHAKSPSLAGFTEVVAPLLAEPVKLSLLDPVPLGDPAKGVL